MYPNVNKIQNYYLKCKLSSYPLFVEFMNPKYIQFSESIQCFCTHGHNFFSMVFESMRSYKKLSSFRINTLSHQLWLENGGNKREREGEDGGEMGEGETESVESMFAQGFIKSENGGARRIPPYQPVNQWKK